MMLSVVIPTHNPDAGRLRRTLQGLRAQSLPMAEWETVLVDNASTQFPGPGFFAECSPPNLVIVHEASLGLTYARLRGIAGTRGQVIVFVDDDNVLDAGYLAHVLRILGKHPRLAAMGGPVVPEWESTPPAWTAEFHGLLALRELGPEPRIATGGAFAPWPEFAPVGAGLAVRRSGACAYADTLAREPLRRKLDRTASQLGSGGDSDFVFTLLHAGGDVGYFPELRLTHLIPASRLHAGYLARLNEGIMRTWVMVLHRHGQCPWPAIAPWTVALRSARAWVRGRAWRSPAHWVRWRGAAGQFQGQAAISQPLRIETP